MKLAVRHILLFLTSILMACSMTSCSCSKPASEEFYVNDKETDAYGRYVFDLDLSETFQSYDLDLWAIVSCNDREYARFEHLPLHLLWQSPTDVWYEEDVYFKRDDLMGGDFHTKQFGSPYRINLLPIERGKWKLYVSSPVGTEAPYQMQGIGIRLTRK